MDMKEYDRKTFIADSAKAFAERRITKREFLRRLGIAGRRALGLRRHHAGPDPALPGPDPARRPWPTPAPRRR